MVKKLPPVHPGEVLRAGVTDLLWQIGDIVAVLAAWQASQDRRLVA